VHTHAQVEEAKLKSLSKELGEIELSIAEVRRRIA
jgi:hypothetical protein